MSNDRKSATGQAAIGSVEIDDRPRTLSEFERLDVNGRAPHALFLEVFHDSVAAIHLLDGMSANCLLLADRAYDSDAIREFVGTQGAWANIPPKKNRKTAITLNDSSIASSIAGE